MSALHSCLHCQLLQAYGRAWSSRRCIPSRAPLHIPRRTRSQRRARPGDDGSAESSSSSGADEAELFLPTGAQDWREFRAKLVASGRHSDANADMWAHKVVVPEEGCILIAHPLMFGSSQEYFYQAVILVFLHDEQGSAGVILNRPTGHRIGEVSGAEVLCPGFSNMPLYLGGDVGENTFHLLHDYDLKSAREVMSGVRLGGFEAAKAGLEAGELDERRFKCLSHYSGWGPGQLARECRAGVWLTAAASSSFILQHDKDGNSMWHQALELMGGEFAQLSAATKGGDDPRIMDPNYEQNDD